MSDYDDVSPIVIDNGSHVTRASFAGDEAPVCVYSTVIGRPRSYTKCKSMDFRDNYVGDEVQKRRGVLSLDYPIEHGIVTNWDDMELIWHDIFNWYLEVPPEEHPCLRTEPPLNPKWHRYASNLQTIFFEKFKVPASFVCMQGVLSCYWSGRGSAIMLVIGDGVTHILPVCEGYCIQPTVKRLDLGGRDLTSYLQTLLHEKGHDFVTTDIGSDGIHKLLYDSIMAIDMDWRKHYYTNIVMSGGCTMFLGFAKRVQNELAKRVQNKFASSIPERMLTNVVAPTERKDSSWIGGSILASLSTCQSMWITNAEYQEYRPDIVNRKCF